MSARPLLVRPPAVAGTFYPAGRSELLAALQRSFAAARRCPPTVPIPKALIVPHAGYVYSGPVAASGYLRLTAGRGVVSRVLVLGPSHFVPVPGIAVSTASAFATPLGEADVDAAAWEQALRHPAVAVDDAAHAAEHSLEVQVPFLQSVLDEFQMLPLAVGHASAETVADLLDDLWGGEETVIVVSTDLSHYHGYDEAVARDRRTAEAIRALDPERIADDDACGAYPLRGLLLAAARKGLRVEELDRRTSGDTAGDRRRVVGYGSFALS